MNLQLRIDLMVQLGDYMKKKDAEWTDVIDQAFIHNSWFLPEFTIIASDNIAENFLEKNKLEQWAAHYHLDDNIDPKKIGIVMAGNIPMVGFHDLLSVFISGHHQLIKLSSKDNILIKHLVEKLYTFHHDVSDYIKISEMLKGCDAYIATGSNNSARYFEQYFSKYPSIIRHNKTSVAVLTGDETQEDLQKLSDDIHLYFGLGCRNITKIFVPENYDFVPLLASFDKYKYFIDHHKYKNNYDYQLSIMLMNNVYYMTNGTTLLIENQSAFSAISVVHYEYYNKAAGKPQIKTDKAVQCVAGKQFIPFGDTQSPALFTYADGIDTMEFLLTL